MFVSKSRGRTTNSSLKKSSIRPKRVLAKILIGLSRSDLSNRAGRARTVINPSSSNRLRFRVISATIARKTTFRPKSNQRSQTITRLQINHRISQKMSHQGARMMEIISVG